MDKQKKPYGSWNSPITPDPAASKMTPLSQVELDGNDIYWIEGRPKEGGRSTIIRRSAEGSTTEVTPAPFDARTRVHEYGGGAYFVHDGMVYFSNFKDQRIYRVDQGKEPLPVTPEGTRRYAEGFLDQARNRIICVGEDHATGGEAVNEIVGVNLDSGDIDVLLTGNDFYAAPRISPDGSQFAWLTWNHPNMPWDSAALWSGEIAADGSIEHIEHVAGGKGESVFQPEFAPDASLVFVSEQTGWWNLYRQIDGSVLPLHETEAEFAVPMFQLGFSTYAFVSREQLICSYTQNGLWYLAFLNMDTGEWTPIEIPYTQITSLKVENDYAVFIGGSPTEPPSVVKLNLSTLQHETLQRSFSVPVDAEHLSVPEVIDFPTENERTAHGFFYPPKNKKAQGLDDEQPPLLVLSHGGPTAATSATLSLGIQYWTTRGFAVLDVNYGGSSGYGRAYRERLNDNWGIVDVDDCVNGARFVVNQGKADPNRTAIRGGSAGGYTTLAALTFHDFFKAGASYYGVSDVELLAKETHKFESRYTDGLIGPYPEKQNIYYDRSPIHFTEQLSSSVIFFQGTEDEIVPPNQAESMVEALREKGLPVAFLLFEGEGHGFRKAENIKRTLESELYFYSRLFNFTPADDIPPVEIENL